MSSNGKIAFEDASREALLELSRLLDDVTRRLEWWDGGVGAGKRFLIEAGNLIVEAEAYASTENVDAAIHELKVQNRPASQSEIKRQLQILIGSFPNAPKQDLQLYGTALVEDVLNERPSILALSNACRILRRTSRFLPTISEVLGVLEREMSRQLDRLEAAQEFEKRIGLSKSVVSEARKRIDAAFERQVQMASRLLRGGSNTNFLSEEVVHEARKRGGTG